MSTDASKTFYAATVVPGTGEALAGFNGSQQGMLSRKLATNERGALAVVNSGFLEGTSSTIRLARGVVTD